MNIIFKILLTGIGVLVFAIIANFIAMNLNITTWYDFIEEIRELGFFEAIKAQSIGSLIFLFLIYPLVLGLPGYLCSTINVF
ncbi:MAG: DUF7672 family protein [Candidatus Woesearchaeota archaeon]